MDQAGGGTELLLLLHGLLFLSLTNDEPTEVPEGSEGAGRP